MYVTVTEYFQKEFPHLVVCLDRTGDFWTQIGDNTVSNKMLYADISYHLGFGAEIDSATFQAVVALVAGRLTGRISNPG